MSDSSISVPAVKCCKKCGVEKSIAEFHRDASRKNGLYPYCKPCQNTCNAISAIIHRERKLARQAIYDSERREERRAYFANYRANNKEKVRASHAADYISHKDARLTKGAAYAATHREQRNANYHRYRSRKLGNGGSHTAQQILSLLEKQIGKCAFCKKDIRKGYEIDHITPLLRNGSNDISNLQLLCQSCNRRKSAKDPFEFAKQNGRLL